jgi:hypothetical protein
VPYRKSPCETPQHVKKQRQNNDLKYASGWLGKQRFHLRARQWGGRVAARSISAPDQHAA